MKSPVTPGLADSDPAEVCESASPTRYRVDKTTGSESGFYRIPERFPSNTVTLYYYWGSRPATFLTQRTATTDSPGSPDHDSEGTVGVDRPAAQPAARSGNRVRRAERAQRATTSRRGCQRASAASSPERSAGANRRPHDVDQPAAGACPRPGRPSARLDRRERPPQRCGAVRCCSRWSA